jgi:hypothetical protein
VAGVVPAAAPAIAEYFPSASMRAVEEIEAMGARGFNYGVRLAGARPRWVWPVPPLAVYYRDDGQTLQVVQVLDGRRVRQLPERG